ncbi:MAG: hypothetical protein WCV50_03950 [Patescibacteria group bacterium]|jgi:hypothetical protein
MPLNTHLGQSTNELVIIGALMCHGDPRVAIHVLAVTGDPELAVNTAIDANLVFDSMSDIAGDDDCD